MTLCFFYDFTFFFRGELVIYDKFIYVVKYRTHCFIFVFVKVTGLKKGARVLKVLSPGVV